MDQVINFALRVNAEKTAFEVQLNTSTGPVEVALSPEVASDLAALLVRSGAESGIAELAQVAQAFSVEEVNFRLYNGALVLVQELQAGLALTSSVDREKLLELQEQIHQLLQGASPRVIQ